ncbi:MAG: Coenzyme F420 hydrogenase/dehydrogenase, beta subunit C-terminal domain [Thermoplasmatota archaeon]
MKAEEASGLNDRCFEDLRRQVIDADLCTRCGGCVAACPVGVLEYGREGISITGDCIACGACFRICPGKGMDMSGHEKRLFSRSRRTPLGRRQGIYRGRVHLTSASKEYIRIGYYGGRITSMLVAALGSGLIDAALLTDWSEDGSLSVGRGVVARTRDQVIGAASSKYSFSSVLTLLPVIKSDESIKRVALVGLPCHIQAVRNMEMDVATRHLTEKLAYLISHNCGAPNMSEEDWRRAASDLIEVPPADIISFRYRKISSTGIRIDAATSSGKKMSRELHVSKFLHRVNKGPQWTRCLICPDYSGELSDISFGAPLIRTARGEELLGNGLDRGFFKRSSFKKSLSQNITDLSVGWRKKKRFVRNSRARRKKGLPVPEYR